LVLDEYVRHYNEARPHRGLQLSPPIERPAAVIDGGGITRGDVLGGIVHEYDRAASLPTLACRTAVGGLVPSSRPQWRFHAFGADAPDRLRALDRAPHSCSDRSNSVGIEFLDPSGSAGVENGLTDVGTA